MDACLDTGVCLINFLCIFSLVFGNDLKIEQLCSSMGLGFFNPTSLLGQAIRHSF